MELRHDRAVSTLCRAFFSSCRNLAVLSGDASYIINNHLQTECVDQLFINYPEPPQQQNKLIDTHGRHLLDKMFFQQALRVLKSPSNRRANNNKSSGVRLPAKYLDGGQLVILTDNLWYGELLLRIIYSANQDCGDAEGEGREKKCQLRSAQWHEESEKGSVVLQAEYQSIKMYRGLPGQQLGHSAEASSYFDRLLFLLSCMKINSFNFCLFVCLYVCFYRLWTRSSCLERYFIALTKSF
jgi:hypothetical protein